VRAVRRFLAVEAGDHLEVLASAHRRLDGGELSGEAEQPPYAVGLTADVVPEHIQRARVEPEQGCDIADEGGRAVRASSSGRGSCAGSSGGWRSSAARLASASPRAFGVRASRLHPLIPRESKRWGETSTGDVEPSSASSAAPSTNRDSASAASTAFSFTLTSASSLGSRARSREREPVPRSSCENWSARRRLGTLLTKGSRVDSLDHHHRHCCVGPRWLLCPGTLL
jgi:hypothetical protein